LTILLLVSGLAACPEAESAAASVKQVVILDLPRLDWLDLTEKHPNLLKLVTTSATGLVTVPAQPITGAQSLGLRLAAALRQNPTSSLSVNSPWQNAVIDPNRSGILAITIEDPHPIAGDPIFEGACGEPARKDVLSYYDELIGRLCSELDFHNTLLLVLPSRGPEIPRATKTALTTVILKGRDFSSGVLCSPSTRKKGIVTFQDLKMLISKFLDPANPAALQVKTSPGQWRTLAQRQSALVKNYSVRWPLLTGYGYLLLGTVFLFTLGLFPRFRQMLLTPVTWVYLYLLTIPAAFLMEALFNPLDWMTIAVYTVCLSSLLFFGSYLVSGKDIVQTSVWISAATIGLIVWNSLGNGYYEFQSFLGYSVVAGARYYGVGNEYMGILLGSYIAAISLYLPKLGTRRREILWCATFGLGILLLHPRFGADVGGGITAFIGLGISNYLWLNQPVRLQQLVKLLLVTLLGLVLAGAWDLWADRSSMSHWGQLTLAIRNHGAGAFFALAARKMELNIRLIRDTPLTVMLIGILAAIPFLYRHPPFLIRSIVAKHPEISAGLAGLSITALIGFLVNDSGIVSAAMMFMFGISMIMLITVKESKSLKGDV
jgi:hypothetical protein